MHDMHFSRREMQYAQHWAGSREDGAAAPPIGRARMDYLFSCDEFRFNGGSYIHELSLNLMTSHPIDSQAPDQPYSIRRARVDDLPLLYEGELAYILAIEPEQEAGWRRAMGAHLRQWIRDLPFMYVAEQQGTPIGYCFWERHGEQAVLASIHVVEAHRRRGIARKLLDAYIADARSHGPLELVLGVKADNPARRLYETAGFAFTHEADGYRHYRYSAG
ncbi:GNAT family N-acetyltransferase [Burkholderia gladioli]|uniref:GNAT family N-acetyltransferase n=2 Tax=Burkholderia gladioli TaxID=28095 RepID=UPI001FC833F4|nr:GNAT family N-acetyltransferase [Burkholderia gladioli]